MRLALAFLIALAPAWALAQQKKPPAMPVRVAAATVAPAVIETGAVGTLFTLYVIPTAYLLLARGKRRSPLGEPVAAQR